MIPIVFHNLKFIQIVPFSDTLNPATKIWVNDETHGTCGLLAVCRYLGRLTELHPSTPENALVVDGSLGLLQSCIDTLEKNTQYDCVEDKTGEEMHDTLKKNDTEETSKALQEKENENAIENEKRVNLCVLVRHHEMVIGEKHITLFNCPDRRISSPFRMVTTDEKRRGNVWRT
eukprot:4311957-Prymnesium_polylepis.2